MLRTPETARRDPAELPAAAPYARRPAAGCRCSASRLTHRTRRFFLPTQVSSTPARASHPSSALACANRDARAARSSEPRHSTGNVVSNHSLPSPVSFARHGTRQTRIRSLRELLGQRPRADRHCFPQLGPVSGSRRFVQGPTEPLRLLPTQHRCLIRMTSTWVASIVDRDRGRRACTCSRSRSCGRWIIARGSAASRAWAQRDCALDPRSEPRAGL
jgi:hypothetical protein